MAKQDWEGMGYMKSSPFLFCRTSQGLDCASVLSVPWGGEKKGPQVAQQHSSWNLFFVKYSAPWSLRTHPGKRCFVCCGSPTTKC